MSDPGFDVFISYRSADLALAELLNDRLVAAGFRVWFDKVRLQPGFRWHEEIEQGCERSRIVLPVLTPRWQDSQWTKYETYGAEAVIPLHFEGDWAEVAPAPLLRHQSAAVDFRTTPDRAWAELVAAIRLLLTRPVPEKVERLTHVRFRPNPHFTGREKDLNKINETLHRPPKTELTGGSVYAITALGGTGKTTLARQYVEKFWRLYRQIFWIDARQDPEAGFATIGRTLFPTLANLGDDVLASRALRELEGPVERLLILDDVEQEESIQPWIPKTGGCHTIITSRFAAWSPVIKHEPLYLLDPEPSQELLIRRSGLPDTPANREEASRLAERLGSLPLALEQAASYIQQEGPGFGFLDYLEIFDRASGELLGRRVPGATEYLDSVVRTWRTTVTKLSWNSRAILRVAAHLSPAGIPKSMFVSSAEVILPFARFLEIMATGMAPSPDKAGLPDLAMRAALQELAAYSMIYNQGHEFRVHNLVQIAERTGAPDSELTRGIAVSVEVIRRSRPGNLSQVDSWPQWQSWVESARPVLAHAEEDSFHDRLDELFTSVGRWLEQTAHYQKAEYYLEKALAEAKWEYGPETLQVAVGSNNLATLQRTRGKRGEAELLLVKALAIVKSTTAGENEIKAGVEGNLGLLYQDFGRLAEAEMMFRRVLAFEEGREHPAPPAMAAALTNLGGVMAARNRFDQAETLFAQALHLDERIWGPESPEVAKSLLNLAAILRETNRLEEAEKRCEIALTLMEAAFGPDHPEVAACLTSKAQVVEYLDRHEEAEALLRRALQIDREVFGPNHEKVAICLNNLGGLLRKTDRLDEAEDAMRQSYRIRERSLGPASLLTIHMGGRLADVLRRRGQFTEAEQLARLAVDGWAASELPRSYKAGRAWRMLARVLRDCGRPVEAADAMGKAVSIYEETLLPGDPRIQGIRTEMDDIARGQME